MRETMTEARPRDRQSGWTGSGVRGGTDNEERTSMQWEGSGDAMRGGREGRSVEKRRRRKASTKVGLSANDPSSRGQGVSYLSFHSSAKLPRSPPQALPPSLLPPFSSSSSNASHRCFHSSSTAFVGLGSGGGALLGDYRRGEREEEGKSVWEERRRKKKDGRS